MARMTDGDNASIGPLRVGVPGAPAVQKIITMESRACEVCSRRADRRETQAARGREAMKPVRGEEKKSSDTTLTVVSERRITAHLDGENNMYNMNNDDHTYVVQCERAAAPRGLRAH